VSELTQWYPNLEFLDPQSVVVMVDVTRASKSEAAAGETKEAEKSE
jgi:hypothetical protein